MVTLKPIYINDPALVEALQALGKFIETLPATGEITRLVCMKDAAIKKAEEANDQ